MNKKVIQPTNITSQNVEVKTDGVIMHLYDKVVELSHEDKNLLYSPHPWYIDDKGQAAYTRKSDYTYYGEEVVYMHRLIRKRLMKQAEGEGINLEGYRPAIHFKDGNTLNYRRTNTYITWNKVQQYGPAEQETVVEQKEKVGTVIDERNYGSWTWFGIKKASIIAGVEPGVLRKALIEVGYIEVSKFDSKVTELGKSTEWLCDYKPKNGYGDTYVTLDTAHDGFKALAEELKTGAEPVAA